MDAKTYADQTKINSARRDHPEWWQMVQQDMSATMHAALRGWPYSHLPREHILNWIDSLR